MLLYYCINTVRFVMKTEKYDDKWSIATNEKGEQFWIDKEIKKAYDSTTHGSVGKEKSDIVVDNKD